MAACLVDLSLPWEETWHERRVKVAVNMQPESSKSLIFTARPHLVVKQVLRLPREAAQDLLDFQTCPPATFYPDTQIL
jgi:hypothetical protein